MERGIFQEGLLYMIVKISHLLKIIKSCPHTTFAHQLLLVTRTLSRHIATLLKMADRVEKQVTKRRRKRSKGFMKKKTTPAMELTEAPATPALVLTSSNRKLALSTQSSASESGPITRGCAGVAATLTPHQTIPGFKVGWPKIYPGVYSGLV